MLVPNLPLQVKNPEVKRIKFFYPYPLRSSLILNSCLFKRLKILKKKIVTPLLL